MPDVRRVSPEQAKKLIDDEGYAYVDVRSQPEYAAGHPAGALNVPLTLAGPRGMEPNRRFVDVVAALYPKEAKLVLGCQTGQRSMRAAELLMSAGFTDVIDQRAGYAGARNPFGGIAEPGWVAAGLPTETTTPGGSWAEILAKAGV